MSHLNNQFFFFKYTATTEIYTLSLHDALPILSISATRRACSSSDSPSASSSSARASSMRLRTAWYGSTQRFSSLISCTACRDFSGSRSEEHTSELQSPCNLVCRLLLEKKKTIIHYSYICNF